MKIRVLNNTKPYYISKETFYEDDKFEIVRVDNENIYVISYTNTWYGGKDVLPEYIKRQLRKIVL